MEGGRYILFDCPDDDERSWEFLQTLVEWVFNSWTPSHRILRRQWTRRIPRSAYLEANTLAYHLQPEKNALFPGRKALTTVYRNAEPLLEDLESSIPSERFLYLEILSANSLGQPSDVVKTPPPDLKDAMFPRFLETTPIAVVLVFDPLRKRCLVYGNESEIVDSIPTPLV